MAAPAFLCLSWTYIPLFIVIIQGCITISRDLFDALGLNLGKNINTYTKYFNLFDNGKIHGIIGLSNR